MTRNRYAIVGLMLASVAAVCGCAKAPPAAPPPSITIAAPPDARVKAAMLLSASADTNPDSTGRPSPIVVRIYQLRADAAFTGADFVSLYEDDQKVLGQELISRDEFELTPSQKRSVPVTVSDETRFLGAVAAFRDIRNAQWRTIVQAPRSDMTVTIARDRIVITTGTN